MPTLLYSYGLKLGFFTIFMSSSLVIINAVRSAKQMGGTLGQGLKKIAAGTIAHSILIITYFLLEKGNRGLLTEEQVRLFFLSIGIFGSTLLILGYVQIYKVSKKLKLFTV